ncbi:hypothetical protein L226DRAFT_608683 [Lentinus tigrinus ALCF2SS1-7]|uniref:Uncharacterized protein n=1 Tax=Lentinus tigrinus ALCF2SS1-6 TaxID=1328759 RepID=A0A5C2SV93_9APHY|nr:hypothetical protein L227DRAFT_597180 [Lentinus tigrinus ALCF2SS1-6]RPD81457.1 hypothetical protein L226DRAFT_608683 [Lentinus tigrinus ALCF2SS1-7]
MSTKRTFDDLRTRSDNPTQADCARNHDEHLEPPAKHRKTEREAFSSSFESGNDEDDLLLPLLDFTHLDTQSAISTRFSQIADVLLHQYRIQITTSSVVEQLELLEIEFYLYKSGCHEDPFTHASPEQSQAGRWYFHRPPSRSNELGTPTTFTSGYRGGTRKGLDITIGQPVPTATRTSKYFSDASNSNSKTSTSTSALETEGILRGGILLRSVRRTSDAKVISGPSLLVDEILRLNNASKISDLVADVWKDDIFVFPLPSSRRSTMRLVRISPAAAAATPRIYRSPRIGLDISHPSISPTNFLTHPRVHYVGQSYRFFAHPQLLTANGLAQTFLGVYDMEAPQYDPYHAELLPVLERLTGWKVARVKKCFAEYMAGLEGSCDKGKREEDVLRQWMGKKGKEAGASMAGWLRMMGTLRRVLIPEEG